MTLIETVNLPLQRLESSPLVYADYNNNSVKDANEPSFVTGGDGIYRLTVVPGTWTIRTVLLRTGLSPALVQRS